MDGNLTHELVFPYDGENLTQYVATNIRTCSFIGRKTTADRRTCVRYCGDGFKYGLDRDGNQMCICVHNEFYDITGEVCVSPQECDNYLYALDGDFLQCVDREACAERGGYAFVYKNVRTCADACPVWWYRASGSECVNESWKKSTAIAVPAAVVFVAVVVVSVVVLVRRKKAPASSEPPKVQMRDEVAHA